jgi:hypothetical protein
MIRTFQIMVLLCLCLFLISCGAPKKEKPVWEQIKIGDLAPSSDGMGMSSQLLKMINFDVYIFEIPAEKIGVLNDAWQMLYTEPLQFKDSKAFGSNFFAAGFGQTQMWDKVGDLLRQADSKKVEKVTLLLNDGEARDFAISGLTSERTVFYVPTAGSMEGVTVGPGKIALRIKAEKIPGSRGVCNVEMEPVFLPPVADQVAARLAAHRKTGEFLFTPAGFVLKMSPGDFVFLGPKKYVSDEITLAGYFFSRAKPKPVVRTYLFVCTRIIY